MIYDKHIAYIVNRKAGDILETKVVKGIQDLTYLSWDRIRNSSGMAGSFLKAYSDLGDEKIYITYLSASNDFKKTGESKLALDSYYQVERLENETPLQFCIRNGWEEYIYQMLAVDFLILNRDRHGANIEVLRNKKKKTVCLAPLFDHGLSLIFPCQSENEVRQFDVMQDRAVQSFVGSKSAEKNLSLIPPDKLPDLRPLKKSDREKIFENLETILPKLWQDKIWHICFIMKERNNFI